jgi:hypothetical protein
MGRFAPDQLLRDQFNDAVPRVVAAQHLGPQASQLELENHSFNITSFREIFSLPCPESDSFCPYYAVTVGDVRLVVLYVTQIWRPPGLGPQVKGRYQERQGDLENPQAWGHGQHIFEPIERGSAQYQWLERELQSPEFRQAPYKVVMLHHPIHTLGDNIVPAFTNPVPSLERDATGKLQRVRYEYPLDQDYLHRDLLPLLEAAGVQLVFNGHSHLWNRFVGTTGIHFLESSNVGNSYGAFWRADNPRPIPTGFKETYGATGDPHGLEPVVPTIAPLHNDQGEPLPYIASNHITVFSILDTGDGTVSSYYFDTRKPNSPVVKFDQFGL